MYYIYSRIKKMKGLNKWLIKILKSEYNYNKKQLHVFKKIYIEWIQNKTLTISSTIIPHNLLAVVWFGETDTNTYKNILNASKSNISIYDIYNLEILKEEDFIEIKK